MKKNFFKYSFLVILLFHTGCGFEVINQKKIFNFSIKQINTEGNKRISQKIKYNLLSLSKKEAPNNLIISIKTKKGKAVKEKNIQNEITKYQVSLEVEITLDYYGKKIFSEKESYNVNGDFSVASIHSTTLNNEKKLIDNLVENVSKQIINKISLRLDDI